MYYLTKTLKTEGILIIKISKTYAGVFLKKELIRV
jgi:hypothetical protein